MPSESFDGSVSLARMSRNRYAYVRPCVTALLLAVLLRVRFDPSLVRRLAIICTDLQVAVAVGGRTLPLMAEANDANGTVRRPTAPVRAAGPPF